ncbi:endonuclease/exonuclease/phosphatase family protein [Acanthamoeba polyphaga mimivirus]|uniref:Endonuclease/exonuclease/phosphatase family protein n=1 Tax=Acanthamoeba polyphaga mimivirus TaxID=212035 RepID=A0A0G2Y0K1_MIMIV|nr:Endonuclease/exonuclease/phosphatase family protein [Acanthamoeba castellanii mamavirus]AKI79158.1 endonuclease/exonuclease/phosphatase family protein [Acanthamoeba polyphaga mimivirus]EJN40829.1 hypothetical protein lvs_L325 [Acanthamoeba polyphaga lentillevirus]UMZ08092.1 endonuclease/exonuclease/phosphatase family protein [Acanthamoeba polyphaga mimivirus]
MKVLNLNVFRGFHTQFHSVYKWENRRDLIINLIEAENPDIILFQECNKLQNTEDMEKFMEDLPNYDYVIKYSLPGVFRSRALIIAYNPNKLIKNSEIVKWFSDTPDVPSIGWGNPDDDFGRIILGCEFLEKNSDKKFWIFNVHFDIDIESIRKSILLLPELIDKQCLSDSKIILAGDFNTDDKLLFDTLKNNNFDRLSQTFNTTDKVKLNVSFVGKRDDFGKLTEDLYLDHVFGREVYNYNIYCPFEYDFIINKYIVSDHLPVVIIFE